MTTNLDVVAVDAIEGEGAERVGEEVFAADLLARVPVKREVDATAK